MNRRFSARYVFVGSFAAFAAGLLVWRVLFGLVQQTRDIPAHSLLEARELGLVSFTVLNNYDLGQEMVGWLLGCVLVPLSLWAVLSAFLPSPIGLGRPGRRRRGVSRRGGEERREDARGGDRRLKDRRGPPPWVPQLGLFVTCLTVFWRPSFWRGRSPWGSFGLLGEEGVYLGAVQALRDGRRLYTDLEFPYGPLLIKPLDWWLTLFGDSVVSARAYCALLTALGLFAAAVCVRELIGGVRGAWWGLITALLLALVAPIFLPTLNSVLLRTALPFLPAALILGGARDVGFRQAEGKPTLALPWKCPFAAAGALTGVALFFSFDSGAAALAGMLLALVLVGGLPVIGRTALALTSVCTLVVTSMLITGNLGDFIAQAQRMIHLPSIGYQALPYPDVFGIFMDQTGQRGSYPPMNPADDSWSNAAAMWSVLPPLFIWLGLGIGLHAPRVGGRPTRNAALLCTAFVAAVMFRAALGRSDLYHLWFYGAVPVVLLSVLLMQRLSEGVTREVRFLLAILGFLFLLGVNSVDAEQEVRFPDTEEVRLAEVAGIGGDPMAVRSIDSERLGSLEVLPRLAIQLEVTLHRVKQFDRKDGVYFFPSEAAYYFLSDRPVPLRYLWAYDAATPTMQRQAIEDLEESKPRWLFRSTDTFSIDHIPRAHLMPQIDTYLKDNYRLVEVLAGATLHERVER